VQMRALAELLHGILARWGIAPKGVIGHSDMAVGRKSDPGLRFDWQGLARQGLSVWVAGDEGVAVDWQGFMADARAFGYRPVSDDLQGFSEVLTAFRLRFAPHETGDLNTRDMGMMRALARDFSY
ncbi:MAG: N-acetylmuramoyl-L-alanine amidase, partial [Proteobacteria bacterium]|nr:N-acetylmuramoyl-L-alanine amidase [Pseudomonadota bacterium]